MKVLDKVALVLIIIGAINWGLVGLFKFNLVDTLFGSLSALTRIIYILVLLATIWLIISAAIDGGIVLATFLRRV